MNTIKPPALNPGDTIGVMSTSCWVPPEDIEKAKTFIEGRGFKVFVHPQATVRLHQSAGSAAEKAAAFNELVANPAIKAIFSSRGGNRAITMLDKINFDAIAKNPKILIGYSDVTTLLNSAHHKTGLVTFQGPLFRELPGHPDLEQMFGMLAGEETELDLSGATQLKSGTAAGKLLGGNLSLFQTLLGSPYLPDVKGAILLLEDIGDHVSRYDRMLGHLRAAGVLGQLSGIVFGDFTNLKDDEDRPFGFSLEDVILEHTEGLSIPILMNAPFGHGKRLCTLPIGCRAALEGKTLKLLESPVTGVA